MSKITDENRNIEIAKVYGEAKFRDMLVFDTIIYNIDRHLGNFGMIIDNNTGKFATRTYLLIMVYLY